MQTHINELEKYSRRNSIRIFGIEKQINEKLAETFCESSKQKLSIDYNHTLLTDVIQLVSAEIVMLYL